MFNSEQLLVKTFKWQNNQISNKLIFVKKKLYFIHKNININLEKVDQPRGGGSSKVDKVFCNISVTKPYFCQYFQKQSKTIKTSIYMLSMDSWSFKHKQLLLLCWYLIIVNPLTKEHFKPQWFCNSMTFSLCSLIM